MGTNVVIKTPFTCNGDDKGQDVNGSLLRPFIEEGRERDSIQSFFSNTIKPNNSKLNTEVENEILACKVKL